MDRVAHRVAGYELERVLGRGGMGVVYLARHPRLPRSVALKVLDEQMFSDAEARARFQREADLAARLDHPNIVAVYDRGVEDRVPWIAMQYVEGTDAGAAGIVEPSRAIRIVGEVAAALDFAHSRGVLHRDIKPTNILLTEPEFGQPERVLLADFGIARLHFEHNPITRAGSFSATLDYAAPEQLAGLALDSRCDQYSLACTFFALITGSAPFAEANPVAVIQSHMTQEPPPVSKWRPGIPEAADFVLRRAMSKDPDGRFVSCTDFVRALQSAFGRLDAAPQLVPVSVRHIPAGNPAVQPTLSAQLVSGRKAAEEGRNGEVSGMLVPGFAPVESESTRSVWKGNARIVLTVVCVLGVAILAFAAVFVYQLARSGSSDSSSEYMVMEDIFSSLTGQVNDDVNVGFRNAKCVSAPSIDPASITVRCSSPGEPTFEVIEFDTAAGLDRGLNDRFGKLTLSEHVEHKECGRSPVKTLVPPAHPLDGWKQKTIVRTLTTFPDDPVRSRFLVIAEYEAPLVGSSPDFSGNGEVSDWWSEAPLCG